MRNSNISLKALSLGLVVIMLFDQIFLLVGAVLLQQGILSYESANLCAIISLVCAAMVMGGFTVKVFAVKLHAYIIGSIYIVVMLLFSLTGDGGVMGLPQVVKAAVAVFSGCLVGNCFGGLLGKALHRKNGGKGYRHLMR